MLTAEAVGGEVLEWEILTQQQSGSTLSSVPGKPNQREYVAGGNADPALPFFVDKIEIKKTTDGVTTAAYIHVLTTKDEFTISPIYLSEASDPANGTVQFELRGKNGPIPPERVIWKLLCGEGTFDDKTGVYTEPKDSPPGSFIIVSGTLPGDVVDLHGVTAVPLPLSKYAELIAAVNSTIAAD
ncbi:hypothetical protein PS838_00963 [Pseudomonas fluorescens]|nr:hypothetical protein PS838_00963 [Pseudomonas fluorescens]